MAISYEDELDLLIKEADDERVELEKELVEEPVEKSEEEPVEEVIKQIEEASEEKKVEEESEEKEEVEEQEEESEEEESEIEETKTFEPIEVELYGQNVTLNSEEELKSFIKKGAEALNKEPETHKEEKQIIQQGNLTQDDLNLLIDAKNGKPEAIAKIIEIAGTDIETVNEVNPEDYKQEFQAKFETDVDEVANDIIANPELHKKYMETATKVPQSFIDTVQGDANHLRAFSEHIKSGLADKIIPEAIKAQALNGGDFLTHYATIGRSIVEAGNKQVVEKKEEAKPVVTAEEKELRKKAAGTRVSSSLNTKISVDDIATMPFDELMKKETLKKLRD